jgi:hypothetical protein
MEVGSPERREESWGYENSEIQGAGDAAKARWIMREGERKRAMGVYLLKLRCG